VVLKVGNQQVTQADLEFFVRNLNPQVQQAAAGQGRRPLGEQYALMLLLSQEALSRHLDDSPDFRRQMEWQRVQWLAQAEYKKLASQVNVSPEEIGQYYSTHPAEFEQLEVRQIGIRKKAESAKEGAGLSPQEARARLDAIRTALAAGTDAKKVTQDFTIPNVVFIDAQPRSIRHGQLPGELDKKAFQLKDGDFSEPLDTPQGIFCIQAIRHDHPELKTVSAEIENKLRQQKVQATLEALKKKAAIWMDEDYFKAPAAPAQKAPGAPPSSPAPTSPTPGGNQAPHPC
jgi:peptidyl-prolyl cis-trans isomerase C